MALARVARQQRCGGHSGCLCCWWWKPAVRLPPSSLVRGFHDHDPTLKITGVVLNGVSTPRHQQLLSDVLEEIGMLLLGYCLAIPPWNYQAGIWECHLRSNQIGPSAASNGLI